MQTSLRSVYGLLLVGALFLGACSSLAGPQSAPAIPGLAQTLAAQTLTARDGGFSPWSSPEPIPANSNPLAVFDYPPTPRPQSIETPIPQANSVEEQPEIGASSEERCTNLAKFVEDISVPDWEQKKAGERFVKTWRFQNVGTCTWTPEYAMVFIWGEQLNAEGKQYLGATVKPEEFVNVSMQLTAPKETSYYQGNWMFEDTFGERFGTGYRGRQFFWVAIAVGNPGGRGGGLGGGAVEGGCIKGG